jgi:hypothetical protein
MNLRPRVADLAIGIGRIVASRLEGTKKAVLLAVRALEGDDDEGNEESADEGFFGQAGIVMRPREPVAEADATGLDPQGYAEVIGARWVDAFTPIASRDLRLNARVNPKVGEVCLSGYGGGFLSVADAADLRGSIVTLYAPVEKANLLYLDPDAGACGLVQQDGAGIFATSEGVTIKNVAGDGFIDLNSDQCKITGQTVFVSCGSFVLYVPNALGTEAHAITVDDSDGSLSIIHRSGAAILMGSDGALTLRSKTGAAVMTITDDGVFINGSLKVLGTGVFASTVAGLAIDTTTPLLGVAVTATPGSTSGALFAEPA